MIKIKMLSAIDNESENENDNDNDNNMAILIKNI